LLEKLCRTAGFIPDIRCRTDHYDVILGMVRAGLGVGMVPALGLPVSRDPGLALARIEGVSASRRISLVTRPGNPNPLVPEFARDLAEVAQALQPDLEQRWRARAAS
jgi:DNA-binding transcriptional LysR family regulator